MSPPAVEVGFCCDSFQSLRCRVSLLHKGKDAAFAFIYMGSFLGSVQLMCLAASCLLFNCSLADLFWTYVFALAAMFVYI